MTHFSRGSLSGDVIVVTALGSRAELLFHAFAVRPENVPRYGQIVKAAIALQETAEKGLPGLGLCASLTC